MKVSEGLVIFITGGASGLGEAAARRFHSEGASVAVADLDEKRMQSLQDDLKERILCLYCNVTKEEDVKQAIKQTVERYGTIHVALAAAGVMWPSPMLSSKGPLDTKSFEMLFRINVFGSAYVAKYAAIEMSKNKATNGDRGVILFVSSVAAEEGQRRTVAYSSSKGAINGMVLPMARDLGRYGIRVMSI
jgi:3-hydroxyacyl-CoA dehydrogenase / 3-hydroxy-2-methylbutyryl-CoA dehydrogenase